ncbi:GAF domain-containing protein [Polyangium aurulentum]|uniref:GAF domain-containing protein n=1 Tax=Polyangium aurulentum TaxID=2567896 RepID=UPI00146A6E55|nr:GAF domain-containing protein [Polyangium aurulentum]UQA55785.1 GAF domain-containing protein [Polyangium aurulentum]
MAGPLEDVLPKLTSLALALCRAGSAGVSVLEAQDGREVFRWHAVVGPFEPNQGLTLPRNKSLCDTVIARNDTLLFPEPERHFGRAPAGPPIIEALTVPFHDGGNPVGTLWVLSHSEGRHFDAEDGRLLTSLSRFATAALTLTRAQEAKRTDALLDGQKQVLEMLARGEPLSTVLGALCGLVERLAGGRARCSLFLLEPGGRHLRTGAAPSLPEDYNRAFDGIEIRPNIGCCAAAASRRQVVVCEDLASDPGWAAFCDLPLALGLKAAWSMPITSAAGEVLGTFGTYFFEARGPTAYERRTVEILARTAALAIERRRADEALRESEGRHRFLANLAAATQMLVDAHEIMAMTARMLAEHLAVDRCAYAEIEDERIFVITGDYTRDVQSIVGRWPVAGFGAECERLMLANEAYVIDDVDTDARAGKDLAAYRATQIQAVICVPLHKAGRFTAAMAVHQKTPRHWTAEEVALVRQVVARCWEVLERARTEQRLARMLEREREQGRLLQQVANAALTIHGSGSLDSVLRVVAEEARQIIGAHQSVTSLTRGDDWSQAINTVSMSSKYERWRGYSTPANGKGIYAEVCKTNRPMRLTQAELLAHPSWRNFSGEAAHHPPMRGWLAVPFVGRSGKNLGLVQLSDKLEGEFTESDEAILVQLAHIASVAIENARLYDELRDQDRRKDEFLATLAHELRNPLAPIRTGLEILKVAGEGERGRKLRDMMERQVGHMVRMVDDLLDVSRITRGKVELRRERVELRAVVESAVETSRPLIESAGHELRTELPAEPLLLDADPTRLAQVFANLLNNAAKYTPAGGRIRLVAERAGARVVVRVEDTGVGIPADMLPKVFDMFTQVGRSIDRAQGGLGIGLTLVQRLVVMHGGTIDAESEGPGRGSTFTVRLPLATVEEARPTSATQSNGTGRALASLRVLVVDDNIDGAESLSVLLQLSGHQTQAAHSGPEALTAAQRLGPDMVFLDIGLPGMNGYEVARKLRAMPDYARCVLVALTGWGTDEDRRQARAAGFDHHLTKPVDAAEVHRLVALVAEGRGAR